MTTSNKPTRFSIESTIRDIETISKISAPYILQFQQQLDAMSKAMVSNSQFRLLLENAEQFNRYLIKDVAPFMAKFRESIYTSPQYLSYVESMTQYRLQAENYLTKEVIPKIEQLEEIFRASSSVYRTQILEQILQDQKDSEATKDSLSDIIADSRKAQLFNFSLESNDNYTDTEELWKSLAKRKAY